ncbi:hypothetical protein [Streptosporangium minutum]|uniref:hypothetical protein n=1 Tax=Streptosporangium minutum TaxID=569862 RepID=UPI0013FD61FB|nr:hypothetical protein [Streptosporangium minutum]
MVLTQDQYNTPAAGTVNAKMPMQQFGRRDIVNGAEMPVRRLRRIFSGIGGRMVGQIFS